jgi:hypothetical protein
VSFAILAAIAWRAFAADCAASAWTSTGSAMK